MERWQNRVAAVTGASSGIGAAIVQDLVKAGLIVVGLARRKERVEEIRKTLPAAKRNHLHVVRCDVTDLKSVNEAFDWIVKNLGGVDILVNNAGTHIPGQLLTHDVAILQQIVQTNIMGVVYCTQRAFQSMKQRKVDDGHIIIINSVLGHGVLMAPSGTLPEFNIYPATKHAMTAVTEVLRQELKALGTNIKITSISPGLVDTEIVPDSMKTLRMLHASDISGGVMYAISTAPHVQVHDVIIKPVGETF